MKPLVIHKDARLKAIEHYKKYLQIFRNNIKKMKTLNLIFPNQIFEESELLNDEYIHFMIEEYLFFNQYNFHKQKIYFHRCSMKNYLNYLKNKKLTVKYINSYEKNRTLEF